MECRCHQRWFEAPDGRRTGASIHQFLAPPPRPCGAVVEALPAQPWPLLQPMAHLHLRNLCSIRSPFHRSPQMRGGGGNPCRPGPQDPRSVVAMRELLVRGCVRQGQSTTLDSTPCVTVRLVVAPLRGPGQSPVLPFACCVGSLLSVGRCGRCSCWCRFRVRGAQSLVYWGCAECGGMCRLRVSGTQ